MRDISNTSRSPRGLMTLGGSVVIVQPGETRSLDVSDAEAGSWAQAMGAEPLAVAEEPAGVVEGAEGGPRLVHRGFGKWYIFAADAFADDKVIEGAEPLSGPFTKAEGEAALAVLENG